MATQEIFTSNLSHAERHFPPGGFAEAYESRHFELPIGSFRYQVLKPVLDLLIVLLALPLALPIGALVAVFIRITSPGPVFYRHRRIGQFQKPLDVWKFRTMYENSESVLERHLRLNPEAREEWERAQKLKDDPRVTPVGRLLRKTSLDEIPQLLNVLAGQMSIVGPRPIVDEERSKYGEHFSACACALPGITGLWQVSGRSNVNYPERVLMDVRYVQQWSFQMELRILCKTVLVLLKRTGAY